MSRRTERVASLVRQTIGEIILEGMSDPRIDPARVTVTRVEVNEELTRARVFISIMAGEAEQRNALRALRHAAGRIQERMTERVQLRFTPVLDFVQDVQFKKSLTTLGLIRQAMDELHQREQARDPAAPPEQPPGDAGPGRPDAQEEHQTDDDDRPDPRGPAQD